MITQFLVAAGELHGRKITPELINTWCKLMEDLSPQVLAPVLETVLQETKYFPVPADVRARIGGVEKVADDFDAQKAWDKALKWIARYFNPDMPGGRYRGSPDLDDQIVYAVSKAGGFESLANCDRDYLPLRLKEFTKAFKDYAALERDQHLLPPSRAKELVRQLAKQVPGEGQRLIGEIAAVGARKGLPTTITSSDHEVAK